MKVKIFSGGWIYKNTGQLPIMWRRRVVVVVVVVVEMNII